MGAPGTSSGPWVYRDSLVIRDERGAEIAHVIGYRSGPEPEVLFANARQLAASPDLYDQLAFAVKLLDAMPGFRGTAQLDRMHAALAKARGES
jgi:hypothetical protein